MAIAWIILAQFVCVQLAAGSIVNLALKKPVNVSSRAGNPGRNPALAVDGNTTAVDPTGVMHTAEGKKLAWWWVNLLSEVQDPLVRIYFRTDFKRRRHGVQLYTSTSAFTSIPEGHLCLNITNSTYNGNIPDMVNETCYGKWRYLMVYTNTTNGPDKGPILDFGEVEVLGCNGTYGGTCDKSCSSRQCISISSSCDRYNGECQGGCKTGWASPDCTDCHGTYGVNCDKSCTSRQCMFTSLCDRYYGECQGGCKTGWASPDCTVCSTEYYGPNCSKPCRSRHCYQETVCVNDGACNPPTCTEGWMGSDCTIKCSSGYYGSACNQTCSNRHCMTLPSDCDHVTGTCDDGCAPGWTNSDCSRECPNGSYGANCGKYCSARHCRIQSLVCHHETGKCPDVCKDGWTGVDCSVQCEEGTFGLNCMNCSTRHCKGESDCPGDGTCSGGCQEGWTLNNCTQACPSGTYGSDCSLFCGNCTGDDICNHVDGYCPGDCNTGWRGKQCKQDCDANKFGVNCEETCGQCIGTCISTDGHCPNGCEKGYSGAMCKLKDIPPGSSHDITPVVAGIVAGVVVIIIVVIVIVVCRRRKASSKNSLKSQSHETVKGSPDRKETSEGGNMYVNVAYVENEAANEKKEKPLLLQKPKPTIKPNKASPEIPSLDQEEEIVEEDKPSTQKGEYYNLGEDAIREVAVADLADTIQKIKHRKGGFEAEYDRLPIGFTASYDDSQKPENAGKNKFRGYYPYDHNRVRLNLNPNIPGSDYINASLMHSYDQKKTYIAAQAPNKKTVGDFWRMIWEHRCNRVIMLTGLVEAAKVKCYKYWPDEDVLETDQHKVEVEVTDIRANYTIRHLKVTSKDKGECRSIVQYHFTSWPDHGVPDTLALVHFIWMIRRTYTQTDGPLLVHCSAGIGRTGTYVAVDSLLDQARAEGMVNVYGYVSVMRGQRKNMIQTKEQYECVFHCLVDMTTFGNTSMDVGTFAASYSTRGMDSMVDRKTIRELTHMATTEERYDQPDRHKMWVDGNQDYTVRVGPALRNVRGYLQTNAPPSGQERLLWKLVEQNDVHNVVAISPLQVNLFGEKGTTMTYGDVTLRTTDMTSLTSDLTMATLQLHVTDGGTFQNVKLFKFSGSPNMDSMSSHLLDQADLQHLSLELSRVVLIHSESDRKFAILFCIMGNILSGMMEDRRIDVIGHVRTFLKCCPDVTFTEQDVEKLHVFAQKCVQMTETSNTYANL